MVVVVVVVVVVFGGGDSVCTHVKQYRAASTHLQLAKRVWGCFSHLLQADGAFIDTMDRFYQTIIQQISNLGCSCSVSQLAGTFPSPMCSGHSTLAYLASGRWNLGYPHTKEVLSTCHLQPLSIHIQHWCHTLFKHYVETKSLVHCIKL